MTEWEFKQDVADRAHATGGRLWLGGRSYLIIWSLYGKRLPKSFGLEPKKSHKANLPVERSRAVR
jgi:hypothetical protein